MKTLLLILVILLTSCTTIEIQPDGTILVKGPRKATIITDKLALSTGEMLMNNSTITALGTLAIIEDQQ